MNQDDQNIPMPPITETPAQEVMSLGNRGACTQHFAQRKPNDEPERDAGCAG